MSETEKSFTVSDRRHFTPDGRPRAEEDSPTRPEAEAAAPPPEPAAPPEARGADASRGRRAELSELLLGLAAQAGALLSGEGLPEGMDGAQALDGAASVISVLEMLQDKTEGRRTPAESTLLEDLLYQLRMAYVERRRAVGA